MKTRLSWTAICLTAALVNLGDANSKDSGGADYEFVPDTNRLIVLERGGFTLQGTFDAAGNFTEVRRFPLGASLSGPFHDVRFGGARRVYEYRSGRLVRGELDAEGNFVPEIGSQVVRFQDYRPARPDSLEIWNLPGYFKKVEKPKDDKAAKDAKK